MNSELIVELKAVSVMTVEHEVQLVNHLKATTKDVGLLLNFGRQSLELKKEISQPKN